MSIPLHHFCNREFLEELVELKERNVLLLLVDGSAVFGRISRIDDGVVMVLPALGIAGLTLVQFRPPSPVLPTILVSQVFIDWCNIAHVVEGSFLVSPIPTVTAAVAPAAPPATA